VDPGPNRESDHGPGSPSLLSGSKGSVIGLGPTGEYEKLRERLERVVTGVAVSGT
jgi:hypothetical protein